MNELDTRLLAAHAQGDQWALVALYTQAADQAADIDAACFYLTHAYVFALELNHPDQDALFKRLRAAGRV
ncbi:hypothetical protein [Thalassobium sp. R2A62]|jgi:hypothetical protein|uniref:hypothetical protein n=1 Tax=Thalassobium sp. R2A62 TaxID=633131 RepID=UPI0001B1D27D|nr:hypothetical protein [Thalassobium sp. R2A62]EET48147.1 hypothetical protein TR2A62_0443 [Thalassobium sp. R2A62]MDG1340963.1 hypothetical protein [Paracoccaceae bacterium]MDG2452358.1 hypothetical protein [Paracoccaceae bacterium]